MGKLRPVQNWRQHLATELGLTSRPHELASIGVFAAISFVCIAATMGGLLIPAYFGGLLLVGIGKSGKIKRAGIGLMLGPLFIGLMILAWPLFQRIWPAAFGA